MNKRRRYRTILILGTVGLLLTGAFGLWLRSERRQEPLNRKLVAALVKEERAQLEHDGPYDYREAMALVNAGADPNTPIEPLPPTSLRQLWNCLIHRSPLPANHCKTAYLLACGGLADPDIPPLREIEDYEDSAPLRQAMLQHGANVEAEDENGCTGLVYSARTLDLKTLDFLLQHGVEVNGHHDGVNSPLFWAISSSCRAPFSRSDGTPLDSTILTTFIRRLLEHGADPNLLEADGTTVLQLAQGYKRSDLVAVLKQAGAKK